MAEYLEKTTEANRGFHLATGEIPITVSNDAVYDMFRDDTPIVAACDLENPESCESCT